MVGASIAVALVIGTIALLAARRKVLDTTLNATWYWALLSFVTAAALDLAATGQFLTDGTTLAALRYAARVLLLGPTVSLIGAKRPQDGPWNFVVLSLWGILALPSAEALFLNPGQPLEIQAFRSWFLLALILVTLANTLPTRHGLAAVLVVLGQTLLLAEYLPFPLGVSTGNASIAGFVSLATAAVLFAIQPSLKKNVTSLDQLWFDFRDVFGLFWGLRVQERLNAAAAMYQWPVTLTWAGWTTTDGQRLTTELPADQQNAILTTFRGLLRRFVSSVWIDSRLPGQDHVN
jgi:hypothetical protein